MTLAQEEPIASTAVTDDNAVGQEDGDEKDQAADEIGMTHGDHDDSASESEESEEEEEEEQPPASNEMDMDDDYALLAMAKQRMKEAQEAAAVLEKQEEAVEAEKQQDFDSEDEDDEEAAEDDEEEEEEDVAADTFVSTPTRPDKSVDWASPTDVPDPDVAPSPPRRERDENAELWALLRQSKSRVAETIDLVAQVEQLDKDDSDEEDDENSTSKTTTSPKLTPQTNNEEKKDEDAEEAKRKKDFERENQELWDLLQKSKRRLEEAAMQKLKQAEKAAAADAQQQPKSATDDNPYKDIDAVPDEAETEEALTQKELLLAMAVAEEAARSGKETFETPAREELRTRDISSFDFLKEPPPATPIHNVQEEERERNRFKLLSSTLRARWQNFRKTIDNLEQATRHRIHHNERAKIMS